MIFPLGRRFGLPLVVAVLSVAVQSAVAAQVGDLRRASATGRSGKAILQTAYRQQAAKRAPRRMGVGWTFKNISVQTLLERLKRYGVEVPVELSGQVSVHLSAGAPWRSLLRRSAYEVEADLTSPSLTVAGFELRNVAVHLVYSDGMLQLTDLHFTVADRQGHEGKLTGSANMQVRPPGDLHVNLSLNGLPLGAVFDKLPQLTGRASGTASGQFTASAPVDAVRDPARWQGGGRLTLADLQALGLPPGQIGLDLRLGRGRASLTNLSASLADARATGSAALNVTTPYGFTAQLRAAVPNLHWLKNLDQDVALPLDVVGSLSLAADLRGSLAPRRVNVSGALNGQRLKVKNVSIDRLRVPFTGTLDRIRLSAVRVDLYGGQVLANFSLPTQIAGDVGAGVRVRNVDLGRLAADALQQQQPWRGLASASLQWQAPADGLLDAQTWKGNGNFTVGRGNLLGIDVSRVAGNLSIDRGNLQLSSLDVDAALARVSGTAAVTAAAPFRFNTALRIENVDLAPLNNLPDKLRLPVTVGGRAGVSARVEGTLQPLAFNARGGVAARRLSAAGLLLDTLNFNYDITEKQAAISQIAGSIGGGTIGGSADVALASPYEFALKLDVKNADLSIGNRLPGNLRPPVQVGGVISASADLKGRLRPLEVDGNGNLTARNLRLDGATIDSVAVDLSAARDSISVSRLAVVAYSGRADGTLDIPLNDAGAGHIDLRWQRIDFGRMLNQLAPNIDNIINALPPNIAEAIGDSRFAGWTWGRIKVDTPAGKLADPANWSGDLDISLADVQALGFSTPKAFIRGTLAEGRAELTRFAFDINETRIRGTANLALRAPYDFDANFKLANGQLADFNRLPEAIRPPLKLSGEFALSAEADGTLDPLAVTGNGSLTANAIEAGDAKVDLLEIQFAAAKDKLELTRFRLDLYGGQVNGTATLPLAGDENGRIAFNWQAIDIGGLVSDLAHPPLRLRGTVDGMLDVTMPGGNLAEFRRWTIDASFNTSPLLAGKASLGQLSGRLGYEQGLLDYDVHGNLFGGTLKLAGRWQPGVPADRQPVNEGQLNLAALRLNSLMPFLEAAGATGTITGQVNLIVPYRHDPNTGLPTGNGQLAVDNLMVNGIMLFDELRGQVRLAGDRVELTNLSGLFADGSLAGYATIYLDPTRRGSFEISLSGVELAQLVALVPKGPRGIRGTLDAQLQGYFGGGRPVQVNGAVAVREGRVAGVAFNSVRLPIVGNFDSGGHGTVQMHGASGQVAMGRVVGDIDLTLANTLNLNGKGKLSRVDLRTLMHSMASGSRLASGKISGVYTLAGRNVRTINDLTGTLRATLDDTQAMSLPVLQRTLPYLTGGVSGSTTFDEGTLRATLSRGVVRVERFSLSSGSIQIYAQGNVSISGRLDLSVTAKTGQLSGGTRAIAWVLAKVTLVAAPPVGVLLEATQFLSNQVINLEVTGTIRSPTIRVQPLQLLGQEAAQFFLYQALP